MTDLIAPMARKPRPRPAPTAPVAAAEAPYATDYHAPVMVREVVNGLVTRVDGVYVDATLGGGGHSAALLAALGPAARVIGIDRDEAAIVETTRRLAGDARFRAVRASFADLTAVLDAAGLDEIDGLLLDLGVSSRQIDEAGRGFSFSADGPLDMRMDRDAARTAADFVNGLDADELAGIPFSHGEEPRSRAIARAIIARRPLEGTGALADAVRSAVPFREEKKSLARVFQALRIAVNAELEALEAILAVATRRIRAGGRIAVIAYHSLEDRRVKRYLRAGNLEGVAPRDVFGRTSVPWRLITRHALEASAAEVAANPRARSARLRIAERTDQMSSPDPRDGGERGGAGAGR